MHLCDCVEHRRSQFVPYGVAATANQRAGLGDEREQVARPSSTTLVVACSGKRQSTVTEGGGSCARLPEPIRASLIV